MRAASIAAVALCCFAVSASAESIHGFDSNAGPEGKLVIGTNGALYGTTRFPSTAFKVTPSGVFTELHRFDQDTEGYYPGGLMRAADGNFYGQLPYGAANGTGSIYRMTPAGQVSIVTTFLPTLVDEESSDPLVQAPDGNFYGAARHGGPNGYGSIFRMTPDGVVTVIHEFNGRTDGYAPIGPLAIGSDGALYGVTTLGYGNIFRITASGVFTILHTFDNSDGSGLIGGLAPEPNGDFYGVASVGGEGGSGTLFKITTGGQFEIVHTFDSNYGIHWPRGNPTFAADGNLYGATLQGGVDDCGVLFALTPARVFTIFHEFVRNTEGCQPQDGVTQGADGALYGMLGAGGPTGKGGIYRVALPSGAFAPGWIQPPTPVDGERWAYVGSPVTIPLRAADPNPADVVHIAGDVLPATSSLSATDGNPANATFTWTPTAVGTQLATFVAASGSDGLSAPRRSFLFNVRYKTMLDAKPALLELSPTGVHLRMKAVLTTPEGPVAGKRLDFVSSTTGVQLCSATTDSVGVAACGSVQTFARIAVRGYTVVFSGDSTYASASASAGIIGQ